jgi:hypothetical protein
MIPTAEQLPKFFKIFSKIYSWSFNQSKRGELDSLIKTISLILRTYPAAV